jgi:hypothetical protein
MKRYLSKEPQAETGSQENSSEERPDTGEPTLNSEKKRKSEELRLSQLSPKPVYGRPSSCDANHRFGKRAGST